jgi:hypothetical protein
MSLVSSGLARLALKQQIEFFGGGPVSLDSLWRACGNPESHDPASWSELAAPLLSGFAAYLVNVDRKNQSPDPARLLWIWEDESKDPWRAGDLMSHEFIAWAYATYLDNHLGRRTSTLTRSSNALVCF